MKIVTILGARPQMIKASVVSAEFYKRGVHEMILHTGQHFDANMSDVFFEEMGIPQPMANLGVGGGSHGQNTGRMLEKIEHELLCAMPDWVLVYGDTDSTLAGALAAVKLHIPVAHVEAGLRSYNRQMPEEINRVVTDHVASLHFAPTSTAVANLELEGISGEFVINAGDVMYDVALQYGRISDSRSTILDTLEIKNNEYILATVHRAENTDNLERLSAILGGLGALSVKIVFPVHPRTRKRIASAGLEIPNNFINIEPVGYLDMLALEKNAKLIVTDSGGVQKEAFFHNVPCVTLRDETEWTELVEMGWNRLARPISAQAVSFAIQEAEMGVRIEGNPYGAGNASNIIVNSLLSR